MGNKHCEHLRVRVADRFCADCGVSVFVRLNPSGSYGPRDPEQYVSEPMRYLQHQLDELRARLSWIPVSERLPEPGVRVLTWHEGQNALNGEYLDGNWLTYGDWGRVRMFVQPTHWMPMPALPGPGEPDPLTKVPEKVEPQPSIQDRLNAIGLKDLAESGSDEFLEMMNKPVQHFHEDCVFYANCPACVAGHAGVFNRKKGTDRKCEARFDGGRTHDCEVFPSQFKYPHCQVCGQHHEPPACTGKRD